MATSLRRYLRWALLCVAATILTAYHLVWVAFLFAAATGLLIVAALNKVEDDP